MFKLVIQDDEGKTTVVPLIRDEITIGRKEGNTIRLTERNVSRRHARILRNNGEVQIEDLGSYNGIRVNNARIAERVSLRVSDQVQIGDYKLYLKAEGVEQVDDARTMPIERVDGTATDVMAVPPATNTPTVPLGIPQTPAAAAPANGAAAGLANAQLVGNPNRTLVAIADTDPAGRPVASAAQVAALQAPVGYGRLVVLSSNFAGKEFELSRPQMIVGRTDENDIVINHRSISRNHAKLVREPDTGRYTISDLQSSNGVRVNGQDYGKGELRRGDVVDLGHVRLRFVEAGEDFLFSRDAVITDVPETGGKKGLLVAILLGIIVLGGIGVYFAMFRGGDEKVVAGNGTGATNNAGNTGINVADSGSNGSDNAGVDNGSDTVAVAQPDAAVDNTTTNVTPDNGSNESLECAKLQADAKWQALMDCSVNVQDKGQAAAFRNKATLEIKAEAAARNLEDALKKSDFKTAKTQLGKIPEESVSRSAAKAKYDEAWSLAADDYLARARSAADDKKCKEVDRLIREADAKGVGDRARTVTCKAEVVAVKPPDTTRPNTNTTPKPDPGNGSSGTTTVQKPDCDADALRAKGDDHLQTGMDAAALAAFEAAMRCKQDASLVQKAFMAACRSKNQGKAKLYFAKLPAAKQPTLSQICIRSGINPQ